MYVCMDVCMYVCIYVILFNDIHGTYLDGGLPTPLKNMRSSVGMMKFRTEWNNTRGYFLLIPPFWPVNSL